VVTVRESLTALIEQIAEAYGNGTFDAELGTFVDRLEELVEPAVRDEPDAARYLVSLLNVLVEMRRRTLPPPIFVAFLSRISTSLDDPPIPVGDRMPGEEAEVEAEPEVCAGCTMMRWTVFSRYYAPRYGRARSAAELEELWQRIEEGQLRAPLEDLHLTASSGLIWITHRDALFAECGSPGSDRIQGTAAYDALGLDWPTGWSYTGPTAETRAVIVEAPVSQRRSGDRGLRVPTAVDAWGNLGFVPRRASLPRRWPSNAGITVDPTSGRERLPEAIHGPRLIAAGADCPVRPCSPVQKAIPDRIAECGIIICMKAIGALRTT
jgi:hypothetical protein